MMITELVLICVTVPAPAIGASVGRRYPPVMADPQELSQEAHDRLRAELTELTGEGRIDIARKIEAARMLGDLSENGDYHAAKDQQGKMEARIRHLQSILRDAVIVDTSGPSG